MFDKEKFKNSLIGKTCTTAFLALLEDGSLDKVFGGDNAVAIDTEFKVLGFDAGSGHMKPDNISDDLWNNMDRENRENEGIFRTWANVVTNRGTVSLRSIMGNAKFTNSDFWADVPAENKSKDFDISKIFIPSVRHAKTWILSGADNIVGKTLKCVAVKVEEGKNFKTTHRAFEIVG